jgi:hypothetical protein
MRADRSNSEQLAVCSGFTACQELKDGKKKCLWYLKSYADLVPGMSLKLKKH